MGGSKNYGTFTQWNSTQQREEGAYILCNSIDGTGEHYAKWNKPGGEGQIPYDNKSLTQQSHFHLAYKLTWVFISGWIYLMLYGFLRYINIWDN